MDLQQRLERLERENRRLKAYALGALAFLGLAAALELGMFRPAPVNAGGGARTAEDGRKTRVAQANWKARDQVSPNLEFRDKNGEVRMRIGVDADGEPYIQMRDSKSQYESAFLSYEALFRYTDKAGNTLRYSDIDFFTFDFVDQERGTSTQLRTLSTGADASYFLELKDKKKSAKLTTDKLEFKP